MKMSSYRTYGIGCDLHSLKYCAMQSVWEPRNMNIAPA